MQPITEERFTTLTGGFLVPSVRELEHYTVQNERLLGLVARDLVDNDYSFVVLARDVDGAFCAVGQGINVPSQDEARNRLALAFEAMASMSDEELQQ